MPVRFLISPCGCAGLVKVFTLLAVIDSDRLVGNYFQVIRLVIDGINYEIDIIFEDKNEFLTYLNDVFRVINSLAGHFIEDGDLFYYENVEDFTSIEVVAIITWIPKTAVITTNTDIYQDNDLIGKILDPRIFIDSQAVQVGYDMGLGIITFDPITGTIFNINVFIDSLISFFYRDPIPA